VVTVPPGPGPTSECVEGPRGQRLRLLARDKADLDGLQGG
jgi:hypothetical protein